MTREEKIKFIIQAIEGVEGVHLNPSYFENYTDEKLDREVEFYDYVLDK